LRPRVSIVAAARADNSTIGRIFFNAFLDRRRRFAGGLGGY